MRLNNRLHRLEQRVPKPPPQCAGCGYPVTAKYHYVVTRHADPLPRCPQCSHSLAEDGTPIFNGYKRIVLARGDVV